MADLIHRRLGDFEIVREIGRGGMGVVYEALQLSLHRRVALKVLTCSLGLTSRAIARFQREAEAAAKLHHGSIVPVYATGEHDGLHFYVMELIAGPSLDHVLRRLRKDQVVQTGKDHTAETLPPDLLATGPHVPSVTPPPADSSLSSGNGYFDTVARLISGVADALEHAHQNGVIHRDIKPANLLLAPDGRLCVNDFGLARLLEQPSMTVEGEFVGTPAYMSPEQVTAGRIPLDHRTDIYSLGATLYELLTMQPPFTGERRDQLLAQIVQKEPLAPRKLNKKVPVDLETICLKALDKDPDRRYQSAAQMADDLRAYINQLTIKARRARVVHRLGKWGRRNPWLAGALAAVLILVVSVAGLAYQGSRERQLHDEEKETARATLCREKMERAQATVLEGNFDAAEEKIREAVDYGASEAWADWRRGQIAFHRGETDQAIGLLNRAVPELGDNVAALALRSLAISWGGEYDDNPALNDRLDRLEPIMAEDWLYKGAEQSVYNPDEGLRALNRAIDEQKSLIGLVLRAQVRADRAFDAKDLKLALEAIDDARMAKTTYKEYPSIWCASAWTQLKLARLYAQSNQNSDRDAALARMREDLNKLVDVRSFPRADWLRGVVLEVEGEKDKALDFWRTAVDKTAANSLHEYRYGMALYRSGEVQKAVDFVKKRSAKSPMQRMLLAWFLGESPADHVRALEAFARFKHTLPASMVPVEEAAFLLFLGKKEAARQAAGKGSLRFNRASNSNGSFYRAEQVYLARPGPDTSVRMLAAARGSQQNQADAHFLIGLVALANSARDKARECFKKCTAVSGVYFGSYKDHWARAFLARMEQDAEWPRWIQAKQ